ncbi:MAG: transcriptional repressor [Dehalococcoidia bacterium]|nr:MAG: transcriptional repressor [Dehalococcoidia bacterium]
MIPIELKRRKLHGSGCKATPQRLSVLEAVDGMRAQFTPQQLYERLQKQHPDIGLVTVYRTLKLLAESGLICRMGYSGRSQSYARRPQEHHHHLVCAGCDKVVNVSSCGLGEMERKLASETGFAISDHHLEFMGLCRQCRANAPGETK